MLEWLKKVFEARQREAEVVKAAEDFAWVWADTVNTDAYAYGASLDCAEVKPLAHLFEVLGYDHTAAELIQDHAPVCTAPREHTRPVGEKAAQ